MFTGFLKPITSLIESHPGVAFATTFAAAAAPAFLKDEHRGYLRTAIVTTPIIAAMGIAGPGLVTAASRQVRSGLRFARQMPFFDKNYSVSYKDLRNFMESGNVDLGSLNPALRNWVDDAAIDFFSQVDKGAPPIEKSLDEALGIFNRLMGDDGKRTLLTYAVEGARQRSASPLQLAGEGKIGPFTAMSESDLRGIVNANRADQKFVNELSRNLRWADRIKDAGALVQPLNIPSATIKKVPWDEAFGVFHNQRPEVAEAIEGALAKGYAAQAFAAVETLPTGEVRMLGVELKHSVYGDLKIPLFDKTTGTVRMGEDYKQLGVGRRLYSAKGMEEVDIFVAQHLSSDWEALKKDINRAAYFGGVDPLNEFKMATHQESQLATLPAHAILLRSQAAIPTSLPEFTGGKTFEDLEPLERIALYKKMLGENMTRIGSEGGTAKGVFEFAASELYTVGGLPSLAKQTPFYRSFSKELQLATENIPPIWKPRISTTAAEALGNLPELRMTVAGISPQQKSLFGDLPANMVDLDAYAETAIKRIMKDQPKLSYSEAEEAWGRISRKMVKEPSYFEAAKKIGGLGEGGILLHNKFGSFNLEAKTTTRVDQLHINPEEFKMKPFGSDQLIGFSGLEPITSNAPETFVESYASVGNQFELTLRQRYAVETGAKVDVAGVKGLAILAEKDEFEKIKELMNIYGQATKSTVAIPDFADAIAPLHYTQAKVGDPFRLILEQAAEVAEQLGKSKYQLPTDVSTEVNQYLADLTKQGISSVVDDNTKHLRFLEDSNFVQSSDRAARMAVVSERTSNFMQKIGELAQDRAPWAESDLFAKFRRSGMPNLMDYMQQNAMVASAAFWDTTRRNVSQIVSATWDMFSEMFRSGNLEGIKDIFSRLDFQGGDPAEAAEFARTFVQQDFTKPLGNAIPILEAAPAGLNLGTMEGRVGGIFDPSNALVQKNFSLALKEPIYARVAGRDVEVTHIPVLGKMAFGGGSNLYEKPGEGLSYSPTKYEKALAEVVKLQDDSAGLATAATNLFEETHRVLFGKEGFYRAKGADVMGAVSGFIQTRASQDPFQMFISEQMARRVRDSNIREALLRGEEILATAVRHPIQTAPYMKVRVAPEAGLGPNMISMDERIRALFGADDDKDILSLFFYRKGSQAEREGLAAANTLNSEQWKSLKTLEMLYGSSDDSRNIVDTGVTRLTDMVKDAIAISTPAGRAKQVTQRMAGATTGAYSNLVSRLVMNIEMHPTLGNDPEARTMLGHLSWIFRQVPISAQKGKMELNPEDPLSLYRKVSAGLDDRTEAGAQKVIEAFQEAAKGYKKESILTEQSAVIYSEMTGKPGVAGDEINALEHILASEKTQKLIKEFVIKRDVRADRAAQLLTRETKNMTGDSLYALQAMYKEMGVAAPYLQGLVHEKSSGGIVSRVLGAINETTRAAARDIAKSGSLPVLAAGFGLAAAGAILTSTLKSPQPAGVVFNRGSGKFRPEEVTNVPDRVPGEPIEGTMSSVNPPRRQLPAYRGTSTTIVAPMRQRSDVEVRMKAQDRKDTTEIQRMIRQVSGNTGVSNINVNYRNGWRNKMSKLRQREIIREQLGS